MKIEQVLQKLKLSNFLNLYKNNKVIWIIILASGLIALSWDLNRGSKTTVTQDQDIHSIVDTIIPRGYTLVPIEVQNYEALDSVFGNFGFVTLYSVPDGERRKSQKLAERVKMLRAPQNPSQFGVLLRESEADQLAGHIGPVFVVLHSRSTNAGGVQAEARTAAARFKIVEEQ